MTYDIRLSWKLLIPLGDHSPKYSSGNKYFNIKTSKTFMRQIGGARTTNIDPYILEPTVAFHNSLTKIKHSLFFSGKKFPYNCLSGNKINFRLRLYFEKYIILEIKLLETVESDENKISIIQDIRNHQEVYKLSKAIQSFLLFGPQKEYYTNITEKFYPCIVIYNSNEHEIPISDSKAVSILTRHENVINSIVEAVITKNENHQLDKSRILLDRQGVLCCIPFELINNKQVHKKIKSVNNLIEFSIVISAFLQSYKTRLYLRYNKYLHKIIFSPELVFLQSTTTLNTWKLLVAEFKLFDLLNEYERKYLFSLRYKLKKLIRSKTFIALILLPLIIYLYKSTPLRDWFEEKLSNLNIFSTLLEDNKKQ